MIPHQAPMVSLCIPPVLREEALKVAAESPAVHPAWTKVALRGRHFTLRTSSIEDIEELADWAYCWLVEPPRALSKLQRQALKNVIDRAGKLVHLEPLGAHHYRATGWRIRNANVLRA